MGGYEYELETLYHIGYRYYDPEIGRFLSIDPIGFGLNWYVYALNDPINAYELFGLETRHAGELYGIEYTPPGSVRSLFIAIDDWIYRWLGIRRTDTTQERFRKAAPKVTKAGVEIYLLAIFARLSQIRFVRGNPKRGVDHIFIRHSWFTTHQNVGRFLALRSMDDWPIIERLILTAIRSPTRMYRSRGRWIFEHSFPDVIGIDLYGRPTH